MLFLPRASVVLVLCLAVGAGLVLEPEGAPNVHAAQRPAPAAWKSDSIAVHRALRSFLDAFENLDEPGFLAAFSESATVFHPAPSMASRAEGRAAIDSTFRKVFADVRGKAKEGPPFHRLPAEELLIQPLSPGIALATFHLRNAERLGRRTVVFRRERGSWKIVHLHASNFSPPP